MTARRLLLLFAPLVPILNQPCGATTAASLSDRITIDGDLSDWAADEWVLDGPYPLPSESGGDSRWGANEEIVRIALTWDARYLYVAVEYRAALSQMFAALSYGPGGFASLDGAGAFRRAIDLPFAPNLLVLAPPHDAPSVARVDDHGVLVLLDRATAPAVTRASLDGSAVFEAALPWSLLSFVRPPQLVIAATGTEEGTGAGDAAPDPSVELPASAGPSSKVRVSLDRWLSIPADGDQDGVADAGVSPRVAVTVRPNDDTIGARPDHLEASLRITPRVFAPDRGEDATFTVNFGDVTFSGFASGFNGLFVSASVYSVDGRSVRVLYENQPRDFDLATGALEASPDDRWDGRDGNGRVAAGGVYVISFEWGLVPGEHAGRATAGVAVAR